MSKKLILNSLSGTTLYLINIVVAFIISPLIIRVLGNRDYGLWELFMSIVGYMGLLDLGIGPALVRFVAVADGRQDQNDLQQTVSTALALFIGVGGIILLLFVLLSHFPQLIGGSETDNLASLDTVLILLGINTCLVFPMNVLIATLMGVQRHYLVNSVRVIATIFRLIIIYTLLQRYSDNALVLLAMIELINTSIQLVVYAIAVSCDDKMPKISTSAVKWNKLRELFSFGSKSATMMIASRLQNQSVPIIISNIIGLGHVVYFIMPNRLIDYAKGVSLAIGFPLTPYFGASIGKGDQKGLLESWLTTTMALQVVSLVMPLIIFFYGETFLALWIGQEYAIAGRWVIFLLLVGLVADSLATNAVRILTASGLHGRNATIWFLLSVMSIPLGIWGASLWGVVGVTLGTTLVTVIGSLVTISLACAVMKISIIHYFKKTTLRIALPLITLIVTLVVLNMIHKPYSYLEIIIHLIIASCIYVSVVWRTTLSVGAKDRLRELIMIWKKNYLSF